MFIMISTFREEATFYVIRVVTFRVCLVSLLPPICDIPSVLTFGVDRLKKKKSESNSAFICKHLSVCRSNLTVFGILNWPQ